MSDAVVRLAALLTSQRAPATGTSIDACPHRTGQRRSPAGGSRAETPAARLAGRPVPPGRHGRPDRRTAHLAKHRHPATPDIVLHTDRSGIAVPHDGSAHPVPIAATSG